MVKINDLFFQFLVVILCCLVAFLLTGCSEGAMLQVGFMPITGIDHRQTYESVDVIHTKNNPSTKSKY